MTIRGAPPSPFRQEAAGNGPQPAIRDPGGASREPDRSGGAVPGADRRGDPALAAVARLDRSEHPRGALPRPLAWHPGPLTPAADPPGVPDVQAGGAGLRDHRLDGAPG